MPDRDQFIGRLNSFGIQASERLGQHFLLDDGYLGTLASCVSTGSTVIEVGAGPGNLTKLLARRARKVVAIEIDRKFEPVLEELQSTHANIEVVFADALKVIDRYSRIPTLFGETQVVASLPFHITEPFLEKAVGMNVENITLVLGDAITKEINESPESLSFGRLSLLAQTFFETSVLTAIPRSAFYPQPRTDAYIVTFYPKSRKEINGSPANAVFARLFRNSHKNGLVVNEIKQALVDYGSINGTLDKRESHQRERSRVRRQLRDMVEFGDYSVNATGRREDMVLSQSYALDVISRMGISDPTLKSPFSRLDNQQIRELTLALRKHFGLETFLS